MKAEERARQCCPCYGDGITGVKECTEDDICELHSHVIEAIKQAEQAAFEEGQREMRDRAAKNLDMQADFLDQTKRFQVDPDYIRERAKDIRALPLSE